MMKKYQSKTDISLSVPLGNGKSAHVSFNSLTGGGSVFYTDSETLQAALEKHPRFGKLFKLVDTKTATAVTTKATKVATKTTTEDEQGVSENDETTDEEEGDNLKEVHFTDLDDAKNYLATTYGVSRTKMRSKKAIEEVAVGYGIKLIIG